MSMWVICSIVNSLYQLPEYYIFLLYPHPSYTWRYKNFGSLFIVCKSKNLFFVSIRKTIRWTIYSFKKISSILCFVLSKYSPLPFQEIGKCNFFESEAVMTVWSVATLTTWKPENNLKWLYNSPRSDLERGFMTRL